MMTKSERQAAVRLDTVELLQANGMTIAGGMWGEAGWIVLPDGRVASICNAFMGLDDPELGLIGLYVYSPPFQSDWSVREGEAPLSDEDEPAPCVYYHLDTWVQALGELDMLKRGLAPLTKPTDHMDQPLTAGLGAVGGLDASLLTRMWARVKDRDPAVTQIDMAAVADLGLGRELWFGIVTRRDQFAPFVTWHDDGQKDDPAHVWQVVKRQYASHDMGEALGHLTTLLAEISNGAERPASTDEVGFGS